VSPVRGLQLEVSVVSGAGARAVNEDAYGVWSAPTACFCVMSDGAGGHRGGQLASKTVVSRVLDWFRAAPACDPRSLGAALAAANDALLGEQQRAAEFADMRATAVVLAIDRENDVAAWAHLGDSRLYSFRDGRVALRTRDHSLAQQMIDTGYVAAEAFRGSPQRATLYAALGLPDGFEAGLEATGDEVREGDVFLLCTDGWWDTVSEEEMLGELLRASGPGDWLQRLEHRIVARGSESQDNYSALAVWCTRE
jgi:serine/threonine protein phosphatase PrpC